MSSPTPTRFSEPPPADSEVGDRSMMVRLGSGVGMSALAAVLAVAPAALRGQGVGRPALWLGLGALSLLPMLVSVFVLRKARHGLRAFAGPRWPSRVVALGLVVLAVAGIAGAFGSALRANTHHFGLAGATFGIVSTGLLIGLVILSVRLVRFIEGRSPSLRTGIQVALAVLCILGLGILTLRYAGALAVADPQAVVSRAMVLDVFAFCMSAVLAAQSLFLARRAMTYAGPPLAIALALLGGFGISQSEFLADVIIQTSPLYAPAAALLMPKK